MASTLTAYIPNTKITETTSLIGFIDTTSYLTRIRITESIPFPGIAYLTLSSGFVVGQLKKIQMVKNEDSTATYTITARVSGQHILEGQTQTITFIKMGDTAELMWTRNGWRIISTSSKDGSAATPVINFP